MSDTVNFDSTSRTGRALHLSSCAVRKKKPEALEEIIDPRLKPFLDVLAQVLAEDYERRVTPKGN